MPTPRAVAKSLRSTATKLARVRDETVREAAQFAVEQAINRGGMMKGYRLIAEVEKVTNKGTTSTAVVKGVPSGFWAIKSYGRRGNYTIRAHGDGVLNLRGAGIEGVEAARSVVVHNRTSGDGRWDRVIEDTAEMSGSVLVKRVDAAVT